MNRSGRRLPQSTEVQEHGVAPRALKLGRAVATALAVACLPSPAFALDKQGSAHGGDVTGAEDGFDISGALSAGIAVYNPAYAARPDNTGITLMRYAAHADVDLIGRKLSLPLDVNMFTDRRRDAFRKFSPTELDLIGGVTTTWDAGPGAVEFGSRIEIDRQIIGGTRDEVSDARSNATPACLEGGTCGQTYVDARVRYLYSLAKLWPGLGEALGKGDVAGYATLGWFAYNPTYAARPDNTDHAFLRYALRTELSIFDDVFSVALDGTTFTSRETNRFRPSELDLTPELIVHFRPWEVHLAYERDMPLDRPGLVQDFVYLLAVWNFSVSSKPTNALTDRSRVPSP